MAAAVEKQLPVAERIIASTETDRLAHPKVIPPDAHFELELQKRTGWILQADIDVKDSLGGSLTSHRTDYAGKAEDSRRMEGAPLGQWANGLTTYKLPKIPSPAVLLNPEKHDPLLDAGQPLVEIARRTHRQLVACLPDGAKGWAEIAAATKSGLELRPFLRDLVDGCDLTVRAPGSWLLAIPEHPLLSESGRMDRRLLGSYLRSSRDLGFVPLDSLAEIHYRTHGRYDDFVGPQVREALALPYEYDGVHQSREFLDLLGSLSKVERSSLLAGKPAAIPSMTNTQRELLRAFWNSPKEVDPRRLFSTDKPKRLPPFPSGIPVGACLACEARHLEAWVFAPPKARGTYPATPEFLAAVEVLSKRKARGWENLDALKFYPATRSVRTYTVDLGGGLTRSITFEKLAKPNMAAGVQRDKLPPTQFGDRDMLLSDYDKKKDEELYMVLQNALMVSFER